MILLTGSLAICAGCSGGGSGGGASGGTNRPGSADATADPNAVILDSVPAPPDESGSVNGEIVYAKDFGAVGDGVTDDGPAVVKAVNAAVSKKATLVFEENKTYYIETARNRSSGFVSPFAFTNKSNVTIDGKGSVFLMAPNIRYFVFTSCSDMKIENCVFDLSVPVYLVGKVTARNGNTVDFTVDTEPYADSYDFTGDNGFSIKYNEGTQQRPHMFMGQMTKTGERQVRVEYRSAVNYEPGDLVFLPNPEIGHHIGEMVYMGGNSGTMVFENIEIRQAPSFIFAIKGNDAEFFFENTDLVPGESNTREIRMVSWRDGFHCKDNRGAMHWNNCEAAVLFDDVYNVGNTLGYITGVTDALTFDVTNYEFYAAGRNVGFNCQPGDVLDLYDLASGTYCGSAEVSEAKNNADGTCKVTLSGDGISGVKEGYVAANRNTGAPGSTITNGHYTGTFRFKRGMTVQQTEFDLLVIWIMVEGDVEGPLPGEVRFAGCTFNGGPIQLDGFNRSNSSYMPEIGSQIGGILFQGCAFNGGSEIQTDSGSQYEKR